jgi:hypothetical protein
MLPAMRIAICVLITALTGAPLAMLPSPFVAWLVVPAVLLAIAGAVLLSVPLVTASAAVALIEYATVLVVTNAPVDVVAGFAFGIGLLLVLELVHFASRVQRAALGPSVLASQVRSWLSIIGVGAVTTLVLTAAGASLRIALAGTVLPIVVGASALGALATSAGLILLLTRRGQGPSSR